MQETKNYGISENLVERIQNALDMNLKTQVKKIISSLHPADQAELLYSIDKDEREKLIHILGATLDPNILVYLENDIRHEIISYIDKDVLANLLSKLDTDDAVEVLEDLKDELTQETIDSIKSNKKREEIEEALSYPEDSVGRIMTADKYIAVPKDWKIEELVKFLKKSKNVPEELSNIVVVDEYFRPVSIASVGNILKADADTPISNIMSDPENIKIINADLDQAEAATLFSKYDLQYVPVVNHNGVLVGVLNSNDIMYVIKEEAQEDLMLLGNVDVDQTVHTGIFESVRKRLPWLLGAITTASIGTTIINSFSSTIQHLVILSALIPLIANLSGVAGNQALTITVRNLSNKTINKNNVFKIIIKEILTGLLNGIILGAVVGIGLFLWKRNLSLSLIFSTTVLILQTVSCFIGIFVPLTINKLKLDPAVASGAFITASLDALSSLLLLGMATEFLLRH